MKKSMKPGDMFNAFQAKKKMTMKKLEGSKADKAMDKKMGYKEGSKKDTAMDKKMVAKANKGVKKTGTYKGKSNKLGGGGRFAQIAAKAGGGKKGAAIAAAIGRKKYGKSKMQKMATAGKKRAAKRSS